MIIKISHQLLEFCRFRVPDKSYHPPKNLKWASNIEILICLAYYSSSIVSCWVVSLDVLSLVIWLLSLALVDASIYKRLTTGYNEINKIEQKLKRNNKSLPKHRKRFWRQFYDYSLIIDFVSFILVVITFALEKTINFHLFNVIKNVFMSITLLLLMCQSIIMNLYERYQAQDIYKL